MLRISKTERSGGRWFFSCARGSRRPSTAPNGKRTAAAAGACADDGENGEVGSEVVRGVHLGDGEGCGFFVWARPEQMQAVAQLLTPLL